MSTVINEGDDGLDELEPIEEDDEELAPPPDEDEVDGDDVTVEGETIVEDPDDWVEDEDDAVAMYLIDADEEQESDEADGPEPPDVEPL